MKLIKQTDMLSREEALKKIDDKIYDEIRNLNMASIHLKYVDNGCGWGLKQKRNRVRDNVLDVVKILTDLRDLRRDIQWSTESRFRLELD